MVGDLIPFGGFNDIWNKFSLVEKNLNDIFSGHEDFFWTAKYSAFPKLDLKSNQTSFVMELALAGYDKEQLKVLIDNDRCIIKGEKKEEKEEGKYLIKELSNRSFEKVVILPNSVDRSAITAVYKNGVLTVTLPKLSTSSVNNSEIPIQ